MSANVAPSDPANKMSDLFDQAYKLYESIVDEADSDNKNKTENNIKKAISLAEEATRLVSVLDVFSTNESVDEVATEDLRYFLLPALLGCLNLRVTWAERMEVLEVADVYFRDFLERCKEYGLTDVEIPMSADVEDGQLVPAGPPNLNVMARDRNAKIKRYKEQKQIEEELAAMKGAVETGKADDEMKRKYYTALVKKFVNTSLDELKSLELEKPILLHMEKLKKESGEIKHVGCWKRPVQPLQTVIITKDELQKKVYGLGYPSIPTFTVDEFYDQRVKEGWFPPGGAAAQKSLQDFADSEKAKQREESEEVEKEVEEEQDDPTRLARARAFDEHKDEHRRGWGNRMNRS